MRKKKIIKKSVIKISNTLKTWADDAFFEKKPKNILRLFENCIEYSAHQRSVD